MKTLIIILLLIAGSFTFGQKNQYCAVEDVAEMSLKTLTILDSNNIELAMANMMDTVKFKTHMLQNDILKDSEIIMNDVYTKQRERLTELTTRKDGREINWSKIEMQDFTYNVTVRYGARVLYGKLFFTSNEKLFNVKIEAFFHENEFHLIDISGLKNRSPKP